MPRLVPFGMGQTIDIGLTQEDVVYIQRPKDQGGCPVSTTEPPTFYHGCLSDNFVLEVDGAIRNPVFYGIWVERGSSRQPAQLFVEGSIPEIAHRLVERVIFQMAHMNLLNNPGVTWRP